MDSRWKRCLCWRGYCTNTLSIRNILELMERQWQAKLHLSMILVFLYGYSTKHELWSWFKQNHLCWNIACGEWTAIIWVTHLRMIRETFLCLCQDLDPFLKKQQTCFRKTIPVSKRIAMALWRLATDLDYHSIGQSICCKITHHICQALVTVFLKKKRFI